MIQNTKKNGSPVLSAIIIAAVVLFAMADSLSGDIVLFLVGLAALLLPLGLVLLIVRAVKRAKKPEQHTHDRIDHSRDLRINPKTGKADHGTAYHKASHSAKEHWKQQLDGLLANGTIDKAEYRALMNRRF